MANPAPTINQINAFNATQGTTIDFNIIGGTELVRSNRIYIYDLSDNSLICTHLYVSTESIHELPPNTDSSIVYESGKSRADFVNGAQYYAQIQTYTDTAGTQGGSGLSVAKMFWCLVNPTLTITTIPSTISTTSYNVSATYTDTSANVVSNIIQQYQFNLYSATGSLLQSSGVVIGSGERQGTSATYGISYNFTGLSVGSSYYVTINVTTTQGMNVSAQSGTFTVSIDTPTLGEATVVNNACDGYISVTSNLSSEYGGSASGEIASFVTDSVNNVSSLEVSLEPIQDLNGYDKPWVGGAGKNLLNANMTPSLTTGTTLTVSGDRLTVEANGASTYQSCRYGNSNNLIFPAGTYYVKCNVVSIQNALSGTAIGFRNASNAFVSSTISLTSTGNKSVAVTLTEACYFSITITWNTTGTANKVVIDDLMISATDVPYEPYENICPIYGYGDGAGKNKLPSGYATSQTKNGITFTVNSDGTITVNGTATATTVLYLSALGDLWNNGSYVLNGCPSGGGNNKYGLRMYDSNGNAINLDGGSGDSFTGQSQLRVGLVVWSGQTLSNVVFKPMIRLASETDPTYEPYQQGGCDAYVRGKNLISASFSEYVPLYLPKGTVLIASAKSTGIPQINYYDANQTRIDYWSCQYDAVDGRIASRAFTLLDDAYYFRFTGTSSTEYQLEFGDTATAYEPYNGQTHSVSWQDEAGAVYGGTLDVVSGKLTVDRAMVTLNGSENWSLQGGGRRTAARVLTGVKTIEGTERTIGVISNQFVEATPAQTWSGTIGIGVEPSGLLIVRQYSTNTMVLDDWKSYLASNPLQVCYPLATPQTYQLTPQQIQTLIGQNNVWSEQGDVAVMYNIPITNLLVKRQDVADVSGTWLTLHSQPVTQASDMDFTFIDFTNQYGKTYKYALVPLLTQTQSGVDVEVEGGYTVSDEVQSVFDGVFIADRTGLQKCKANVGYGNVDMNQVVGSITPIGAKYPIIITNSQNQYHNGSISGTIVPDDYYFNGNLSRIDMVNKRNELEQFLTNKHAKIIKDWNGNIWLVMIMDNVSCTFNNSYGMGIVNFSTNWIEVGDPTNQQDLQATGLIDVGGA